MKQFYEERRNKLINEKTGPCAICIFSGRAPMRSLDEDYIFSVDRNFFYLTGLERQNMVLVLKKDVRGVVSETLYIEPYDAFLAKWVGGRMKKDEAEAVCGVKDIRSIDRFKEQMNAWFDNVRTQGEVHLFLDLWRTAYMQQDTEAHRFAHEVQYEHPNVRIDDVYRDLTIMRLIKGEEELEQMKIAQKTTKTAVEAMMKHARPGMNECEIEGAFDFALMMNGVREKAFPTIVCGGKRATTLHYRDNNQDVKDGEMILVDLGGTHGHYCADISRTFPVNGKFTERQKEIYETVLAAQDLVIEKTRAGMTFGEMNQMVIDFYESRLHDLGLDKDGKTVSDYYYHSVTHSLGLDCHDPELARREQVLEPGMVVTVEPGLYIEDEGIGVRIENDILITEDKPIDLSKDILKTVEDIEAHMAR